MINVYEIANSLALHLKEAECNACKVEIFDHFPTDVECGPACNCRLVLFPSTVVRFGEPGKCYKFIDAKITIIYDFCVEIEKGIPLNQTQIEANVVQAQKILELVVEWASKPQQLLSGKLGCQNLRSIEGWNIEDPSGGCARGTIDLIMSLV